MSTSMNKFTDSVALFTEQTILAPLSAWLNENKGVEVSVDEMKSVLSMPATNQMPAVPSFQAPSFNAPRPSLTTRKPRRGRGEIKGKCTYTFIKGKRSGQYCGKSVYEDGSEYCTTCRNKKGAQRKSARDGVTGILGSGPLVPPSMLPKATNNGPPMRQAPSNTRLSATRIDGHKNLMREINHGFVISILNGYNVAKKILEDPNADISEARDLTPDEKNLAKAMGLAVLGNPEPKVERAPMASLSSLRPNGNGMPALPPLDALALPNIPSFEPSSGGFPSFEPSSGGFSPAGNASIPASLDTPVNLPEMSTLGLPEMSTLGPLEGVPDMHSSDLSQESEPEPKQLEGEV